MKIQIFKWGVGLLFFVYSIVGVAQSLQHPVIWTTPADKAEVLAKIENYPWASQIISKAKSIIDAQVNTHVSNPNAILNAIPALSTRDDLSQADATRPNNDHVKVLNAASFAAMVYYVTGEEKYAQFAADILWYYIEIVEPRTPRTTAFCGRHIWDLRSGYPQFAIAYDFMVNYLKQPDTRLYQKSTGTKVPFDNVIAQKAVHNIAMNALHEHGGSDTKYGKMVSNHPVLTAPGALFTLLCVEDDAERERMFNVFWKIGTKEQNSFTKTILPMFGEQGIWPESVSYGFMQNITLVLNIVDRLKPEMNVMANTMNILDGNFLFDNLRMPNRRFVRYGDSKRDIDKTAEIYRYTLNLAHRRGFTEYEQKAKVALRQSYDSEGGYDPSVSISTFGNYKPFDQLFWGMDIPKVIEGKIDFQTPTVVIKHAGVALQRNYVSENNAEYGLCGIIGGAHYVHSHCTGITMELYGAGYIMAPNAGMPISVADRKIPLHRGYFWRHAGNNTMIVNGTTHGKQPGSWHSNSDLWMNTTVNVAAEPKHLEDPVHSNFSFATQFLDDKVNNDQQQRTLSTIRTSETTAYYFDMFRSKSLGVNNFHDYIYHNLGDEMHIFNSEDQELDVTATTRYQTDIGDAHKSPGWRFFEDTKVTAPTNDAVKVRFDINSNNRYMHMFMPGGVAREYTKALGPATREALNGYVNKKTQIIAIRQQGEAWEKPYISIFEPGRSTTSSVVEVEHLYDGESVIGAKVVSQIGFKTVEDYILCLPNSNGTVKIPKYGISFTGRFAVVRYEQDLDTALTTLYIGEGDSLVYGEFTLKADANRKGVLIEEGEPYFGRQLFFKNIKNKDVVPKGTNLSIEAVVGEEYTEVALWANDTINMGTKTGGPYLWSGHDFLTNMQNDEYTFTLIAKDALGLIVKETVIVETPGQKPYPDQEIPHSVPGKIQFEDYDSGGENLGYFDKTIQEPLIFSYRDTDNVDLGRNGTVISSLEEGEWLEYTIYVEQTGYYKLSIRQRTTISPGVDAFSVLQPNNGDTLLSKVRTLYTGRSDFYVDDLGEILLKEGKQVLRFSMLNTGFDLDYMELSFTKSLGVNTINLDQSRIEIFPNPSQESFTIDLKEFKKAEVIIYNMAGKVKYQQFTNTNKVHISNGTQFLPGIYLIKVITDTGKEYNNILIIK